MNEKKARLLRRFARAEKMEVYTKKQLFRDYATKSWQEKTKFCHVIGVSLKLHANPDLMKPVAQPFNSKEV